MEKEALYLSDWFSRYIKNRDLAFRKIEDIKQEPGKLIVYQTDGKIIHYYIIPFIEDFKKHLTDMKEQDLGIITYNTPSAFNSLIKEWKNIIEKPSLVIYFINPFGKEEKKWILRPRTHHLISDQDSLKEGLRAIYETVDPVDPKEISKIIS